jgi:electron-transferring-flavoprotein dehydrogenase
MPLLRHSICNQKECFRKNSAVMENPVIETDILIIGGGPAGLATAIHLSDLIKKHNSSILNATTKDAAFSPQITLIEKGKDFGQHSLSGALINPAGFRELLPDIAEHELPFKTPVSKEGMVFLSKTKAVPLPFHPPQMTNKGNYVVSLGKIVLWLSRIAEARGVQAYPGVDGHELIYENGKVVGVRTNATGRDKHGQPLPNYQPPTDIRAKITILAEGTCGHLTKNLIAQFNLAQGRNPQVYSLGIKELWEVPTGVYGAGQTIHTLGFPLNFSQFGGGFIYGLSETVVAVGLVVGLDYEDPTFDPHHAFQIFKTHPYVARVLKKGKIFGYGAKTIPEGGFFAIPQLYHDNVMIVGDSAGFLAMSSLKGIHLAVQSGMMAAKAAFEALRRKDTSAEQLSLYEKLFKASPAYRELFAARNFRQAFKTNMFWGILQFAGQMLTGGRGLSLTERLTMKSDDHRYRRIEELKGKTFAERESMKLRFDNTLTFDKEPDLFYSGTKHNEEQPSHILVPSAETCQKCFQEYDAPCQRFCPAQVFEVVSDPKTGKKELLLHPANCVHCKTCDIKDPYGNVIWVTPYGGDGPHYENM